MEGEAEIVTDSEKGEMGDAKLSSFCDNLPEEEAPMTTEEKTHHEITNSTSAYPKAAVEESKDDTEAAGEEEEGQEEVFFFFFFPVSNDDRAAKLKLKQLNETDYPKEDQENSGGEDASEIEIGPSCLPTQMIFADEGVVPATSPIAPTPGKKKSVSTKASLGRENINEHSWFAKEQYQIHNHLAKETSATRQNERQMKIRHRNIRCHQTVRYLFIQ